MYNSKKIIKIKKNQKLYFQLHLSRIGFHVHHTWTMPNCPKQTNGL